MYIINPAWIYLIEQLDRIHNLFILLTFLIIIVWIVKGVHIDEDTGVIHFKSAHDMVAVCLVVLFATVSAAVPTRETGYKMLLADKITADVLKDGHEVVKDDLSAAIDKVVDAIKEAKH